MAAQPQTQDVRESLNAHVASKGYKVRQKYGPAIGWSEVKQLLADRSCVRYPCEIVFDAAPLQPGELAHPVPKGARPEDGFVLHIHPFFMTQLDKVPYLVLYQLVLVNYGEFAAAEDAEVFGSHALGIPQEEYYRELCVMADQLNPYHTSGDCRKAREDEA